MARYERDYGRYGYGNRNEDQGYREGWGMEGLARRFWSGGYDRPYRNRSSSIGGMGYWSGASGMRQREGEGYGRTTNRGGHAEGWIRSYDRDLNRPRREYRGGGGAGYDREGGGWFW